MDDRNFDEWIKGRLDRYEDPSFDPAALAGFHEQMAGYQSLPWYQAHLTHYLVAASLTLFTVVNTYLFWPEKKAEQAYESPGPDKTHIVDSLTYVIEKLNTRHETVIDSVTQYYQQQLQSQSLIASTHLTPAVDKQGRLYAGSSSEIPTDLYEALRSRGLVEEENGQVYLTAENATPAQRFTFQHDQPRIADVYEEPDAEVADFYWNSPERKSVTKKKVSNQISAKTRKLIEKHYSRGIGIGIAPHVDGVSSYFSQGEGSIQPRIGVTADWIFSPSISVETGVDYNTIVNKFDRETLQPYMPGVNYGIGDLEGLKVTNKLMSVPVAVKYRQWLNEKNQAVLKGGYTPYFSLEENREYSYDLDLGGYGGPPHGPDHRRITEVEKSTGIAFYGGTYTITAGINHQMKKAHSLEASLFYEKSLGAVGQQNLSMSMLGLRAAYWFGLR